MISLIQQNWEWSFECEWARHPKHYSVKAIKSLTSAKLLQNTLLGTMNSNEQSETGFLDACQATVTTRTVPCVFKKPDGETMTTMGAFRAWWSMIDNVEEGASLCDFHKRREGVQNMPLICIKTVPVQESECQAGNGIIICLACGACLAHYSISGAHHAYWPCTHILQTERGGGLEIQKYCGHHIWKPQKKRSSFDACFCLFQDCGGGGNGGFCLRGNASPPNSGQKQWTTLWTHLAKIK